MSELSAERLAKVKQILTDTQEFGDMGRLVDFALRMRNEDVPALIAEVECLTTENEALRHIIASMNREPETYAANGLRVKAKDGRVTVEYEGGN